MSPQNFSKQKKLIDFVHNYKISFIQMELDDQAWIQRSAYQSVICDELDGNLIKSTKIHDIFTVPLNNLLEFLTPVTQFYLEEGTTEECQTIGQQTIKQRHIVEERIQKMKQILVDQYQQTGDFGLEYTTIRLGMCRTFITQYNKYGIVIIDGQHRLAVCRELIHSHPQMLENATIFIILTKAESEQTLRSEYVQINDNYTPVPEYYLNDITQQIIDEIAKWFSQRYDKAMFSSSTKPQRPHINLNVMKLHLSNNEHIKQVVKSFAGDVKQSTKMICDKIDIFNRVPRNSEDWRRPTSNPQAEIEERRKCQEAYNKCFKYNLYLGMWNGYEWITMALIYQPKLKISFKSKKLSLI